MLETLLKPSLGIRLWKEYRLASISLGPKLIFSIAVFLLAVVGTTLAQNPSSVHQKTTPGTNARFEIVQSQLAARWTFRLDRFTGQVAQLVSTTDDEYTWEAMEIDNLPSTANASRPHFQIFTSGIAARHTFLVDTDTGKTWLLVTAKRMQSDGTEYEINLWQTFAK